MKKIKVLVHNQDGTLPRYQSALASGMDLHSSSDRDITVAPMSVGLVPTGLFLQIAENGYEAQVRSRSGLAVKHQVFVLNSPGTIDADYTGEIKVILFNAGSTPFKVCSGDRIAQLVFCPVVQASLESVASHDDLKKTDRGQNGFGSSGTS